MTLTMVGKVFGWVPSRDAASRMTVCSQPSGSLVGAALPPPTSPMLNQSLASFILPLLTAYSLPELRTLDEKSAKVQSIGVLHELGILWLRPDRVDVG